jgi:hypothetical protein
MSGDYKYDMQLIAEGLAEELYEADFYELPKEVQYKLYDQAMQQYTERMCDQADYLRKAERENQ